MTTSGSETSSKTPARTSSKGNGGEVAPSGGTGSALETSKGTTSIADSVVSKIAGMATREMDGVYKMGAGSARAMGALRDRLPGSNSNSGVTDGVAVEVGQKQAAVDIDVVVEYGVKIAELAQAIRRNVINAIETMTGLEVTEVNVAIDDVHLPTPEGDQDDQQDQQRQAEPEPSRVQ